jgi:hypothetical protein
VTKRTQAQSGRTIRTGVFSTQWQATVQYPILSQQEFRPIQAYVGVAQGGVNEFDIILPSISYTTSTVTGLTATALVGYSAGTRTIQLSTNYSGGEYILKAGDFIRFANHTKVYMVLSDVGISGGSTSASFNVEPPLYANVSLGESVTTTAVPFRMILSDDVQEWQYNTTGFINYSFDMEEVY